MIQANQKIFLIDTEYELEHAGSGFEGELNQEYNFGFRCKINGEGEDKGIVITLDDRVIKMWVHENGGKPINELAEDFAMQIVKTFLPELNDNRMIRIWVYFGETAPSKEGINYYRAYPTMFETARRIIFGSNRPNDGILKREILKAIYNINHESSDSYIYSIDIHKALPLTKQELERNIRTLILGGFVTGKHYADEYQYIQIQYPGLEMFDNPDSFKRQFGTSVHNHYYNNAGDVINNANSGDGNEIIIKSSVTEAKEE